jgi:formylglycine-generating enzyme required for sulfatase activity
MRAMRQRNPIPFIAVALFTNSLVAVDDDTEQLKRFRSEFVRITPGSGPFPKAFQMGGQEKESQPVHKVEFGYSFEIAKYEVTQELWQTVMGSNPSRWKGPRNSVEMLSYSEANDFCRKVTKLLRDAKLINEKDVVRLPTEAEWEYCARAGTESAYSFGDRKHLDDHAWHTGNAAGNDPPVGAKKPNPWGIYDVHGYLWEWCLDAGTESYNDAPDDGTAHQVERAKTRIVRGGSWKDPAPMLTSSFRRSADQGLRDDAVGLRCVLAIQNESDGGARKALP